MACGLIFDEKPWGMFGKKGKICCEDQLCPKCDASKQEGVSDD